jgi:purine-binding chemotaxis protein CheW
MNLAEIRKKAQRDKEQLPPPPATEDAGIATAGPREIPEPLPDETSTDLVLLTDLTVDVVGEEAPLPSEETAGLLTEHKSVQAFDPLAMLLAGRESASPEEDHASSQHESSGPAVQEFLCFRVANEAYAINIMDIKEIIKPREVTEVPRVPDFVSGVLSLRGIIIPVFHMRHRLGLPTAGASGKERIVVVKKGEDYCGLLVDEVIQVVKIAAEGIEQPPAVLDGIDRDFVGGIGRHGGKMLILLNLEKVIDVTLC